MIQKIDSNGYQYGPGAIQIIGADGKTKWPTGGGGSGTVTSVGLTAGTGISIGGSASPITTSGSFSVTNTAPDQTVVLNSGTGITITGTYPNFTITNTGTTTDTLSPFLLMGG